MADRMISVEKVKVFWHSQVHDTDKWDLNMKLLCAIGLFAGSIVLMRELCSEKDGEEGMWIGVFRLARNFGEEFILHKDTWRLKGT
ncbi:hypothetical protein BUALT_Bualt04G0091800 [Buddleja alternifolia]|uniref:Uncharacterized protein n=1 Tax=Buddleja alternifolia TaxID=168488 RepID=A0AAV6XRX0_9LAMI|nr:hypothetical protein BUALT_Bualt04G0091800 [Buddleja alternifolia]